MALACNVIFMAPSAGIGAATAMAANGGQSVDLKEAFGQTLGEKIGSVWRNYLVALAQQNNRPALLAKAMEDREIEVLEVNRGENTIFLESHEKVPGDKVIRIRCKKGELLTLSAADAVACKIADGLTASREELLRKLDVAEAGITVNQEIDTAATEIDKVIERFNRLNSNLDLKYKELDAKIQNRSLNRNHAIKDIQTLIRNAEYLLRLKQAYPDVPVSEEHLESYINDLKASYQAIRAMR